MRGLMRPTKDSSGIALFMVMGAISLLSMLVTEFTYVSQISQKMAFDALDQVKVQYIAKSGFKLSLLRLRAYQQVKGYLGKMDKAAAGAAVPKGLVDKIWSFPFIYPIPTNLPGLMPREKDEIDKFQKDSELGGRYSALIESESSKMNLNSILASFAPGPSASPSPTPKPSPDATPTPAPSFNPEEARKSLADYMWNILNQKFESDQQFASEYRDFKIDEFVDTIVAWADRTYERKGSDSADVVPMKRAPFTSVSELHMLPGMDDDLYSLLAPALTASTTPGINVNTMKENTLRALFPKITDEEVKDFFKYRDADDQDNSFKDEEDFFKYILKAITIFKGDQGEIDRFRQDLTRRNVRIVTDESEFKITVQAQVNQSVRTLEAWVTLSTPETPPKTPAPPANPTNNDGKSANPTLDTGLKITFMRFI